MFAAIVCLSVIAQQAISKTWYARLGPIGHDAYPHTAFNYDPRFNLSVGTHFFTFGLQCFDPSDHFSIAVKFGRNFQSIGLSFDSHREQCFAGFFQSRGQLFVAHVA